MGEELLVMAQECPGGAVGGVGTEGRICSIADTASEVAHRVTVLTTRPMSRPDAELGTSMVDN